MKMPFLRTVIKAVPVITLTLASIASAKADQSITTQIDAITARFVLAGNTWSMLVSDTSGNVTYYQNSLPLTQAPVSNMKIVTSSGAFGLLGITNAFVTQVYRNGTFNGGVVTGDINLLVKHDTTWTDSVFGTGNARAPLDFIATQLKNRGITQITGKVQVYGACIYNHADTDNTRDIQNQVGQSQSTTSLPRNNNGSIELSLCRSKKDYGLRAVEPFGFATLIEALC